MNKNKVCVSIAHLIKYVVNNRKVGREFSTSEVSSLDRILPLYLQDDDPTSLPDFDAIRRNIKVMSFYVRCQLMDGNVVSHMDFLSGLSAILFWMNGFQRKNPDAIVA